MSKYVASALHHIDTKCGISCCDKAAKLVTTVQIYISAFVSVKLLDTFDEGLRLFKFCKHDTSRYL